MRWSMLRAILIIITGLSLAQAQALDKKEKELIGMNSGQYDFLVYALTWQPTYCVLYSADQNCKEIRSDFYTHGIWPYFKTTQESNNIHPSYCIQSSGCAEKKACSLTDDVITNILIDDNFRLILAKHPENLMKHEWEKHGTCYGKNQYEYFNDFINLKKTIADNKKILENIGEEVLFSEIKTWFPQNTSFRCISKDKKQYLFEVYYLLTSDGKPYYDEKELQIGEKCKNVNTVIPRARVQYIIRKKNT
ncbi:ribonuclease [Salmonella enterica]|nr:ribonuclease [Salmonella enterica]EAZ9261402.1 ribonuclease [Salmonella enterica]EBN2521041.1 ribonuclease [Salmonella enterica]